ncbi:MAG TPA: Si-specific NAD(P)(+) transhydrogenase, partial [Candidatus Polarisedimenticolia bacterium]|nr:Si-specific NAD(P)(+) transhydrogenase [Candidatus Polarisedimenticolia bacterium]
ILYLTGFQQRSFYGKDYSVKDTISVADLAFRVQTVMAREAEVVRAQLKRNDVALLDGTARFMDPHTLEIETPDGPKRTEGAYVLIACGTRPARDAAIPFDGDRVLDADEFGQARRLPRELIVVGAGVIGLEYASMFAALGTRVTLIEQRSAILDFVDREIVESLTWCMRQRGVVFRLGERVVSVRIAGGNRVNAELESGKEVHGDGLLYSVGRQANSDLLNLLAAGLSADPRGRIAVDEHFRTAVPHIYAAGDVIGFPALASTSMEQGRLASCHMFGGACSHRPELLPYGIYAVPEISMVGRTEQELTEAKVPYEFGVARYSELAKGQMLGAEVGMLKILFDPRSLRVLGVHAIGEQATEIVHIGQAVMALGGTMEYFRETVFNYPTLAEAYKVAGLDGLNKVGRV